MEDVEVLRWWVVWRRWSRELWPHHQPLLLSLSEQPLLLQPDRPLEVVQVGVHDPAAGLLLVGRQEGEGGTRRRVCGSQPQARFVFPPCRPLVRLPHSLVSFRWLNRLLSKPFMALVLLLKSSFPSQPGIGSLVVARCLAVVAVAPLHPRHQVLIHPHRAGDAPAQTPQLLLRLDKLWS